MTDKNLRYSGVEFKHLDLIVGVVTDTLGLLGLDADYWEHTDPDRGGMCDVTFVNVHVKTD